MSLYHLAFPSWSGWFYAIIVACKLVFLEEDERHFQTDLDSVSQEVSKLCTDEFARPRAVEPCKLPTETVTTSRWDPIVVAREAEVHSLFDQFIKKMEFTIPYHAHSLDMDMDIKNLMFDPLFSMLCLQRSLLHGFTKRMKDHLAKLPNPMATPDSSSQSATSSDEDMDARASISGLPVGISSFDPSSQTHYQAPEPCQPRRIPLMNTFHFDTLNFDTIAPPELLPTMLQPAQTDLLWDTVMDDFTFPL